MANIKSAIKRIKVAKRNQIRNHSYAKMIKTFTKKFQTILKEYEIESNESKLVAVENALNQTYSKIDKAVKVNVIHKNTAARKKSKLASAFNKVKKC
nr:ribosomal protein S20 [Meringosphaera mediterranea]WLD06305.1 ribosomal protein S20 [Meringosphaera mediterranea]